MKNKLHTRLFIFFVPLILLAFAPRMHAQVVINEYSCSNLVGFADTYGEYGDWIELYNTSGMVADITNYYLSDKPGNPQKWQFTGTVTIPAHGFLKIWASGRNVSGFGIYHTSFKLTQTKDPAESIVFSDANGNILDQVSLVKTQKEHSCGRNPDGGITWGIYTQPTPGSANNTVFYSSYAASPVMSLAAGRYQGTQMVSITTTEPNSVIRYTLDGKEPSALSPVYQNPITISLTKVLKARTFSSDASILPSLIDFNTYFINESSTVPIFSISAQDLVELLNGNGNLQPWGSVEFFDKDFNRITTGYGEFDRHGQDSWVHPQRSLDVLVRDESGYNYAMLHPFFADTERDEFQKFILRACGDDNYPGIDSSALIRDDFVQTLSVKSGMSLDERKSARCIVFANGQYWGVYSIREKPDDHDFTKYYYDQDKYDLLYLMLWGNTWAEYGGQAAFDDWQTLYNYIMTNNMAVQANYDHVAAEYDVTSLTNYMLLNSYVVCSDWLNWNVAWWKGLNPDGGHKKWGYMLWDEDATFGHYVNYTGIPAQNPYVSPCFQEHITGTSDPEGHVKVLNRLLANPGFKQYYIARYADLLNTVFKPSFMLYTLDSMANIIQPEMQRHCTRWAGNYTQWQNNVQKIRNFINTRYSVVTTGLNSCYNLSGPYPLTVKVEPAGAGQVLLNSLQLTNFPWTGNYYGNMDNLLSALETNVGYAFNHWEALHNNLTIGTTNKDAIIRLTQGDTVVAYFEPRVYADSVVINEINYNSAPSFNPGDWAEIYNPHPNALDISGWILRDEDDAHAFVFPAGTVMPSHGYLVAAENVDKFTAQFPTVSNFVGPLGFGFSGNGELIRVFNASGTLIDTVHYNDKAPWPVSPDGEGATLELIDPGMDNALPESWTACSNTAHGTPGKLNCNHVDVDNAEKGETLSIRVEPNPNHGIARFAVVPQADAMGGKLEIYSLSGKKVLTKPDIASGIFPMDLSDLNPGCYIARFTTVDGKRSASVRVIVF